MSHHLDSPIARQDIRLDITDLYVFRGQTGTVFNINVCHSIFGPIPVPGYHPEGMYEFKIDVNGDAIEEITYRLTFDERDSNQKQRYVVRRITGAEAVDPHAAGVVVAQQLALPVDEVDASASVAGDSLVIVLGRIPIVVQPVLNLHTSDGAGEEQCGHQSTSAFEAARLRKHNECKPLA